MNLNSIYKILEEQKNERGMAHWEKTKSTLRSFGIGLTQLKKIAKQIGKSQELANLLWKEDCLECLELACLIGIPKQLTQDDLEALLPRVDLWMLSHVFVQNVLAKHPMAKTIGEQWRDSSTEIKRRCGFALLYYQAKKHKDTSDEYYFHIVKRIEKELHSEENFVKDAMNNALFSIGQLSPELHQRTLKAAVEIGKVEVDYGDNSCEAVDVVKHLTSERIQNKWK